MTYNQQAIRELVLDALSEDEFILLCDDHFPEVHARWSSTTSWQMKVREMVTYCGRQERLDELLKQVEAKNPKKYEKYRKELQKAPQSSLLDEVRAKASEFEEELESSVHVEPAQRRASAKTGPARDVPHPLDGDLPEIKQWFLEKRDPEEQVLLVAATLFSGLERQELLGIYHEMLGILRPQQSEMGKGA